MGYLVEVRPSAINIKAVEILGDFRGSVATLELRRNLAIASAKLDRHRAEQTKYEAME